MPHLPKQIIPIYAINFLLAVSTTIGMTIIPLLAVEQLGLSLLVVGIIEGGTELISNILRLVTGRRFDNSKNRSGLFIFPTALAFIAKVLLCFPNAITICFSKITERISNGAFATPRDAFVAERATNKGIAIGLLSATKSAGCMIAGPLIVVICFLLRTDTLGCMSAIILLACSLSLLSIFISFLIPTDNPKQNREVQKSYSKMSMSSIKPLVPILILSFLFFLGRFNDGLIMLYLKQAGFPHWLYISTISVFNSIMLISSPLVGYYIDQKKTGYVMASVIACLVIFNLLFFNIKSMPWPFALMGLMMWGIQRAGSQITFTALIFKNAPVSQYGSAIGLYSVVSGVGMFISALMCGYLAQMSFRYIFVFSGVFSTLALLLAFRRSNLKVE